MLLFSETKQICKWSHIISQKYEFSMGNISKHFWNVKYPIHIGIATQFRVYSNFEIMYKHFYLYVTLDGKSQVNLSLLRWMPLYSDNVVTFIRIDLFVLQKQKPTKWLIKEHVSLLSYISPSPFSSYAFLSPSHPPHTTFLGSLSGNWERDFNMICFHFNDCMR